MTGKNSISVVILLCAIVVPWLFVRTRRDTPAGSVDLNEEPGSEEAVPEQELESQDRTGPGGGIQEKGSDDYRHQGARSGSRTTDEKKPSLLESNDKKHVLISESDLQKKVATSEASSEEAKWGPTFKALGKDHHGKILVDDYVSFQAGSFEPVVQDKFRQFANEFASEGGLDLKGFLRLKASEEEHEKVLALTMFQSFDHDGDGHITVDDLIQWTKNDASQHNVELDGEQEKYFLDQYRSHADESGKLNFDAFTQTGLTKLVINSYLEEKSVEEQESDE